MVNKRIIILLCLLIFFLRLPSLFEPFTYGDEGIYLTLGLAVRKGMVLYREIHDNKPPLLYLLAAVAGNFSNYRLILFFWSFLTIYLFFQLAVSLFPKQKNKILLATAVFAVLTSLHSFEGNIANAENFMMLPTIVGFWLLIKNLKDKKPSLFFLSGFFFSLAALFKIPAAFDFLAAIFFLIVVLFRKKGDAIRSFRRNPALRATRYAIFGFILPFLATFIYFGFQGALKEYLVAAFFQNVPYLSSWGQGQPQSLGVPIGLLSRGFLLVLTVSVVFFMRKKISLASQLVLLWFSFSLFAALLSSRPYPHYLLQVLPSFSLAGGLIFSRSWEKTLPLMAGLLVCLAFFCFKFWHYRNRSYYHNFYQFVLGKKSKSEYWADFDGPAVTIYRLAEFINVYTAPQDRIFIWGTQPSIYALSRRLPVGRYAAAYHIIDFDGFGETMQALEGKRPPLIIKLKSELTPFPRLEEFLSSHYILVKIIEDAEVYKINQR